MLPLYGAVLNAHEPADYVAFLILGPIGVFFWTVIGTVLVGVPIAILPVYLASFMIRCRDYVTLAVLMLTGCCVGALVCVCLFAPLTAIGTAFGLIAGVALWRLWPADSVDGARRT